MLPRPDLEPKLKSLPAQPGIYQYFNAAGDIIYVGKAINLRSRVRSYFHASKKYDPKTHRLVAAIADIEWIVTGSELEALLLEMNLIKEHRPRYNILLKDDKRYPFIKVTWQEDFPKVESTRRVLKDGARYFGPYTSAGAMRETLNTLRKAFPFLDCDRVITGQDERACLYYDIDLCLGPCIGAVDRAGYRAMIDRLCRFLEGDTEKVLAGIEARMLEHAQKMEFEQAARMRDRMDAIRQVVERQRIIAPTLADQDVVAVAREDGAALAQVFFVRNGKLIGREYFQLDGAEDTSEAELIGAFIKQFYDAGGKVPGEIVVPEHIAESEIIERWLADKRGTRVRIRVPQRGRKRDLVNVAIDNAAETLRALQMAHAIETQGDRADEAMDGLQAALDLPAKPRRIECYDISTLQGTHTVGSMVVFQDAAPAKADYRHFRIKTVAGQDDFASMAEVLTRRFERLLRYRAGLVDAASASAVTTPEVGTEAATEAGPEAGAGPAPLASSGAKAAGLPGDAPSAFERAPDLVLVDGGKGQLGYALAVLQRLGLDDIPLASLAKREEEIFLPGRKASVLLERDSQALYLVQRARDEAHRFAITYNRKLRRQAGLRSSLDTVPGIGPKRRKALLVQFGSIDGIRNATVDELSAVPGMTRRAAEQLKAYL